jgi:hypothetical protein
MDVTVVANKIIDQADKIFISGSCRIIAPSAARETTLFPALAIPVESKREFECPQEHEKALRAMIPKVDKIVTIGWRATEENFLKMLAGQDGTLRVFIVSGNESGVKETAANLRKADISCEVSADPNGFTHFARQRTLEGFLKE